MAQQKGVSDNFRLLLDAIAFERPPRLDGVAIAAERVPAEDQVHALLILPDVNQLMDQVALIADRAAGEAIAIVWALRVEVDIAARGHRDPARLKRPPFPMAYPNRVEIESISEDASRKRTLSLSKRPFASENFKVVDHTLG